MPVAWRLLDPWIKFLTPLNEQLIVERVSTMNPRNKSAGQTQREADVGVDLVLKIYRGSELGTGDQCKDTGL